jgi:hypothetical protein
MLIPNFGVQGISRMDAQQDDIRIWIGGFLLFPAVAVIAAVIVVVVVGVNRRDIDLYEPTNEKQKRDNTMEWN